MRKNRFAKVVSVILVWLMVSSTLGAFPSVVYAATFNIGDTVEVTENLNVRTGPGTAYPEITDPDYIDYAPAGTRGKILDGPINANGYTWWKVDYGPGLYSGWSVEGGLQKLNLPDLIVEDVQVTPDPPVAGSSSTTIALRVKNQGTGNAIGAFFLDLYFDGTYQGRVSVNGLSAGATYTSSWQAMTWPSDTNAHTIKGVVDSGNAVSESNESNNERSEQFTAKVNQLPTCSVSPDKTSGKAPLTVTFTLSASDPDGSITGWILDVNGDGNGEYLGTGSPPATKTHTYNTPSPPGGYVVIFIVTDNSGANDTDTKTIVVGENQPPTCSLSPDKSSGPAPLSVTFTISASDPDGVISSWELLPGDGTPKYTGNGNPPASKTHTYTAAGTFNAILGVTDNDGATYFDTKTISVSAPPSLSFTSLTPGTVSTSDSTHIETFSAVGTNFNNVNQITVSWSGPDSGTQTWNKGDSNWNAAVTVNSDTSMTLLIKVLSNETGTQTKTWTWTVTLKDNTNATASKPFTVTYTYTPPPPPSDTIPPANGTDLAVSEITTSSTTLTWTAPGDDGSQGTASQYDIRYSTSEITEATWNSATQCTGEPTPQTAGSSENFTVTGLTPDTTYYFALKTADEVPNWSGLSNVVSGTTEALIAKPVITSPLTIFSSRPYYPYQVGDTLTATFSITNRGDAPITFDILVVGGRIESEVVDFDRAYDIILNPGDTYDYLGSLVLEKAGTYLFFCAYYLESPSEKEEELLDENNWNTAVPVEIEGTIIDDPDEAERYNAISILVLENVTYITPPSPKLWGEIHGPWEETSDGVIYEIRQIVAEPDNAENIYVVVQYKEWGYPGGYWPKSEDIFKLSDGNWEKISGNLPSLWVNAISVAPSNPDVIYVGGERRGVYKSVDGGVNWVPLEGPKVGRWIFKTNPRIFSLAVDPVDQNTIYVGTQSGAWRKKDTQEWEQIRDNIVVIIKTDPYETGIIYITSIVKYPEGIYRSGGVLKSEDDGHSWKQKWTKGIASGIDIAAEDRIYVTTGSYLAKFPVPGTKAIVDFPLFADGVLRFDGGDWESGGAWRDVRGRNGQNPLPDATPSSVSTFQGFPNMVFVAFPREGIVYSSNFGDDWFPIGLEGKGIKELFIVDDSDLSLLYAFGPENIFKLRLSNTAIIAKQHSPVELRIYDSQGNMTGLINGEVDEGIPGSICYEGTVTIFAPIDAYRYELVGTEDGSYGLEIISAEGEEVNTFAATDIGTSVNATHEYTLDWVALGQGQGGVTVKKDSDGDGVFEEEITTSPPYTPNSASPSNGTSRVSINTALSWVGGDPDENDNVTYKIYFGTGENPPLISGNQTGNSYDPGALNYDTVYHWRVVARDNHGITTNGSTWSFTTASPPAPAGGGGGGSGGAGITPIRPYMRDNKLTEDVSARSEDYKVELLILEGTVALNAIGASISSIRIQVMAEPPLKPKDTSTVALVYEIGPSGATFDPPVDLTMEYDEFKIPERVTEKNLVMAAFDNSTGQWIYLESTVATENDTVTAKVSHFSAFAVLAYTRPASFTVADLLVTPEEVNFGESLSASVLVTNTGDLTDSYEVTLKIDNVITQTKQVTIDGGDSETASFSVTPDTAGRYEICIGDLLGTCEVKVPEVPPAPVPAVSPAPVPSPAPTPAPVPSPALTPAPLPATVPAEQPEEEAAPAMVVQWWIIAAIVAGALAASFGTYYYRRWRKSYS